MAQVVGRAGHTVFRQHVHGDRHGVGGLSSVQDLAILSALGLSRAQTRRVIVWEALTLAWVALIIGIPLGIAGANLAWLAFARSLGISPGIAVPGMALAVLVIGVLAAAGLIGLACSVEATRRPRRGGLCAAPLLR